MPKSAAGQKRQAAQADLDDQNPKRANSGRNEKAEAPNGTKRITRSSDQSSPNASTSSRKQRNRTSSKNDKSVEASSSAVNTPNKKAKIIKKGIARPVVKSKKPANPKATKNPSKLPTKADHPPRATDGRSSSLSEVSIPIREAKALAIDDAAEEDDADGPSYWLMKAEPDSRMEKGKDVKFSIDDLMNATEPEAWDGVRNPTGKVSKTDRVRDMAFFYHSNCKKPGIVGTMEIVREHSVDASAFDKEHPYHDEKSTEDKPKWCVVHVEFRRKFPNMVSLKELQQFAKPGGTLENMQTLRMSRLSVSKVSKKEWDFIHSLLEDDAEAA
ncbi:MAG: hypothetical protein Q9202_003810 [Teloschistes flavicans]